MASSAPAFSISPVVAQKDGTPSSGDREFAIHGEIMMIIILTLFGLFIASLVGYLYVKRLKNAALKLRELPV